MIFISINEDDEIVIDFYNPQNKIIHEIKKTNKMEITHIWQVKFYIYILEKIGIKGVSGLIDFPKLRQRIKVELTDNDRKDLVNIKQKIKEITEQKTPPKVINKSSCKQCSYYDLCYI